MSDDSPDVSSLVERVNTAQQKLDLVKKVSDPKRRAQLLKGGNYAESDLQAFEKKLQSTTPSQLESELSKSRTKLLIALKKRLQAKYAWIDALPKGEINSVVADVMVWLLENPSCASSDLAMDAKLTELEQSSFSPNSSNGASHNVKPITPRTAAESTPLIKKADQKETICCSCTIM